MSFSSTRFAEFLSSATMAGNPNVSTDTDLREARDEVLHILRSVNPTFLSTCSGAGLAQKHGEIAKAFLLWLNPTPFELEIVSLGDGKTPMYEGRWTHNAADFVGFKQPPAAANREDATILACAALLRNDWCRSKLPAH